MLDFSVLLGYVPTSTEPSHTDPLFASYVQVGLATPHACAGRTIPSDTKPNGVRIRGSSSIAPVVANKAQTHKLLPVVFGVLHIHGFVLTGCCCWSCRRRRCFWRRKRPRWQEENWTRRHGERYHHDHQQELQRNDKGGHVVRQVLHGLVPTLPTTGAHVGRACDGAQGQGERGAGELRPGQGALQTLPRRRVPDAGACSQPQGSRVHEIAIDGGVGEVRPGGLQKAGGYLGAEIPFRAFGKLQGPGRGGHREAQGLRGAAIRGGDADVDGVPVRSGNAGGGNRRRRGGYHQRQATKARLTPIAVFTF